MSNKLFSDNRKTIVIAALYLKWLLIHKIQKSKTSVLNDRFDKFIDITFLQNFEGLWKSFIKLSKRHLTKSHQDTVIVYQERSTNLCLIKSCVNYRSVIPLSTDPSDLTVLTLGHFFVGAPLLPLANISFYLIHVLVPLLDRSSVTKFVIISCSVGLMIISKYCA